MYMIWLIYFFNVSISKYSLGVIPPVFKYLNIYVPKSTMVVLDPFKGSSYASVTCSENFRFNTNSINRYHPNIILYLLLAELSTWKFHVTTSVALSAGKVKSILTLILVVIFPAYVFHCIWVSFSGRGFSIVLIIKIVELYPLSNGMQKCFNFFLPFLVFIHPCRLG